MVSTTGPLAVPDDWQRQPTRGPREVFCDQCCYWVEWKLVTYKGCLESEPPTSSSTILTECYWCYAQRQGLSHTEAKAKYKNLMPTKRGARVESYQEAVAYRHLTTSSSSSTQNDIAQQPAIGGIAAPKQRSYKEERKGVKRVLDQLLQDRKQHKWHEDSSEQHKWHE